jgi:hypothetical protein
MILVTVNALPDGEGVRKKITKVCSAHVRGELDTMNYNSIIMIILTPPL